MKTETRIGAASAAADLDPLPDMPSAQPAESRTTAPVAAPEARSTPAVLQPTEVTGGGQRPPRRRRSIGSLALPLIVLAGIGGGGWYGYGWWTEGRFLVSTDDAYVAAATATISSKVAAHVASVAVAANQHVHADDVLVQLDDGDFRLAVQSAEAKLATQMATIGRIDAEAAARREGIGQAQAQRQSAQAELDRTEAAFRRASSLAARDAGSQAQLDNATADRDRARAAVASAVAGIAQAEGDVKALEAQHEEARQTAAELALMVERAKRDLSFTVIRAPSDGIIANKSVEPGDYVTPGKRLAALVSLSDIHVDANFKETQIDRIVPGQEVRLAIDALPGETVIGHVASVAPGSGSVFSLLPPDNATGNFTKIVQRVPVRISLPADVIARDVLRPGLSVVAAADTRTSPAK